MWQPWENLELVKASSDAGVSRKSFIDPGCGVGQSWETLNLARSTSDRVPEPLLMSKQLSAQVIVGDLGFRMLNLQPLSQSVLDHERCHSWLEP